MKIITSVLLICVIALGINACSPETSFEIPNNTANNAEDDSTYIDYYAYINDNDTLYKMHYVYDHLKRVIEMYDTEYDPQPLVTERYKYYYNSTDTLPYKLIFIMNDIANPADSVTTYFYYNNMGLRIKDSSIYSYHWQDNGRNVEYSYRSLAQYSYQGNKILGFTQNHILLYTGSGISGDYKTKYDTATIDARGNIINSIRVENYMENNQLVPYRDVATMTYDNHINPLFKLSNRQTFLVFPWGETLFTDFVQPNNRTSIVETNVKWQHDFAQYYSFGYLNNGYLDTVVEANVLNQPLPGYMKFVYKKM